MAAYDPKASRPKTMAASQIDALLPVEPHSDEALPEPRIDEATAQPGEGGQADEHRPADALPKTTLEGHSPAPPRRATEPVAVPSAQDGRRLRMLVSLATIAAAAAAIAVLLRRTRPRQSGEYSS
jgi:hypothetical protein